MSAYSLMTDEQLLAELTEWRAARKKAVMGGVAVVAGEGRRKEFFRSDTGAIEIEIGRIERECARRGLIDRAPGGALQVDIG